MRRRFATTSFIARIRTAKRRDNKHSENQRFDDPQRGEGSSGSGVQEGGAMSALGKWLTAVVAGVALVVGAGVLGASAQGPWVAPPEANSVKNPVMGVGDARKVVEANCVICHGTSGHGDGPAAITPKPANWASEAV